MNYQETVSRIWRHHDLTNAANDYTNLVRYATMAASSHNTQPWQFRLVPGRISILPDLTRRCPEVDPDDHHLYASLGCAAANLIEAARVSGMRGHLSFDESTSSVRIELEKTIITGSDFFNAIPARQCSRTMYDGMEATANELRRLENAGHGNGVSVLILTDKEKMRGVAEYVAEGNVAQIGDSDWKNELKAWIRFNSRQAVTTCDGLYGRTMGNPDVPGWLGDLVLRFALTPKKQNRKDEKQILSSSGVAVFVSDIDDKAHWLEAGLCYERFALQATALGLRTAFINPPVEVAALRSQFASWLGIGERRPDLVVRFGPGPEMPRSLRRPVEEVIIQPLSDTRSL